MYFMNFRPFSLVDTRGSRWRDGGFKITVSNQSMMSEVCIFRCFPKKECSHVLQIQDGGQDGGRNFTKNLFLQYLIGNIYSHTYQKRKQQHISHTNCITWFCNFIPIKMYILWNIWKKWRENSEKIAIFWHLTIFNSHRNFKYGRGSQIFSLNDRYTLGKTQKRNLRG